MIPEIFAIESSGPAGRPEAYFVDKTLIEPWIRRQWGTELDRVETRKNGFIAFVNRGGGQFTNTYDVYPIKIEEMK